MLTNHKKHAIVIIKRKGLLPLNNRIKQLRKALSLTQQQFANRLGIKRNTVATYEVGKSNPSDAAINLICREFSVNEEWLRAGKGEMFLKTQDSILEQLTQEFKLDAFLRNLVCGYLRLGEEQRQAVRDFIHEVAAEMVLNSENVTIPCLSDAEIEADVERYRQERYAQRDANDVEITSELTPSPDKELDVMSELAKVKRQNREMARQNKDLLTRLEILEKEEGEWEREQAQKSMFPTRSHT